jgi:hypothetical protein
MLLVLGVRYETAADSTETGHKGTASRTLDARIPAAYKCESQKIVLSNMLLHEGEVPSGCQMPIIPAGAMLMA